MVEKVNTFSSLQDTPSLTENRPDSENRSPQLQELDGVRDGLLSGLIQQPNRHTRNQLLWDDRRGRRGRRAGKIRGIGNRHSAGIGNAIGQPSDNNWR